MKFLKIAIVVITAGTVASAQPHRHRHYHERRQAISTVVTPGPVVTQYMLDGSPIPVAQAESMLQAGELVVVGGGLAPATSTPVSYPSTLSSSIISTSSANVAGEFYAGSSSASYSPSMTTSAFLASSTDSSSSGNATGLETPFPDGVYDCSSPPTDMGILELPWLGFSGWAGIQCPGESSAAGFSDITTGVSGDTCDEGCYCGYACPPGYLQQQWPEEQGSTGQSVGGVVCQNGKLYKTRSSASTLCSKAENEIYVESKLSQVASICRTLYPGTEAEVVPLGVQPGQSEPLACPDSNYYNWQGKTTSAQYYVNPEGLAPNVACQWAGKNSGNDAPVVFGVGTDASGKTWISITNNAPTNTNGLLGYKVAITGDNLGGSCSYENGQYCSSSGCNSAGCTVEVISGSATYVLS